MPNSHPLLTLVPNVSAGLDESKVQPPTSTSASPVMDSRMLGRRGSSRRRATSRSQSPARGPRTVQWASRLIDDVLSLAVKFRLHPSRNNIVSVPDMVRAILINRCGVAALHRVAYADLVAASLKYREICPTCNAFYVFVCSDEPSMLPKFMLLASMRQQVLPHIVKEAQRTVLVGGDVQVVLRKYIPLDTLSSVVKTVLRGNPRGPMIKMRLAAWLQAERARQSSLAFDFAQHVDAVELLLALVESSTAEPYFRSSPSVDAILAQLTSPVEGLPDTSTGVVLLPERSRNSAQREHVPSKHADPSSDRKSAVSVAVEAELARRRNASRMLMSPPRPMQLAPRLIEADAQSEILETGDDGENEDNEVWLMKRLSEGLRMHHQPDDDAERTALEQIADSSTEKKTTRRVL